MSGSLANAAQADYWNGRTGQTWAELQTAIDRQLEPLGAEALRALAARAGERILDVGCGAGASALVLAEQVGPEGRVLGVDLSEPLLNVARGRAAAAASRAEFRRADAQTEVLEGFDAVFSRFGVMFFAEPEAAFANLRRALRPGGRLVFVCWRDFRLNGVMRLPLEAALPFIPPPSPSDPEAPGPFAFADRARIERILARSGFEGVAIRPYDTTVSVGGVDETLQLARRIGPLGGALRENPELTQQVLGAVREAFVAHAAEDGAVRLPAAVWIVAARSPA